MNLLTSYDLGIVLATLSAPRPGSGIHFAGGSIEMAMEIRNRGVLQYGDPVCSYLLTRPLTIGKPQNK